MASSTAIAVNPSESTERNPWDQLPEEGTKAFQAFTLFRDGGWERSKRKVAEELKKSTTLIHRWAGEYRWDDRARAWDEFQDQLSQQQAIHTRLEMNKVALTIAQTMQTKALQGFMALQTVAKRKDLSTGEERLVLTIKPSDLVRLTESCHKLQHSVLGKGEEDTVAKIEVIFGSTEEEEEALRLNGEL